MYKYKKLIASMLVTASVFSVINKNVYASENTNIKEKEIIDIANDPNYVVNKGEISLENINMNFFENELVINTKTKDVKANNELKKLKELINNNDGLEEDLINNIKQNQNITNIGYSEALLKLNEKNEILPVTNQELFYLSSTNDISTNAISTNAIETIIGQFKNYGKLTLYTFVDSTISGNERFTVAYSDARWSGFDGIKVDTAPAVGEDFISVTLPSRYTILNDIFWSSYVLPELGKPVGRLSEVSNGSLIYAFDELKQLKGVNTYVDWVRIAARASTKNLTPAQEMYTSQYTHTYSNLTILPSIGLDGVISWGFGTTDKAWTLSSYCITNF